MLVTARRAIRAKHPLLHALRGRFERFTRHSSGGVLRGCFARIASHAIDTAGQGRVDVAADHVGHKLSAGLACGLGLLVTARREAGDPQEHAGDGQALAADQPVARLVRPLSGGWVAGCGSLNVLV